MTHPGKEALERIAAGLESATPGQWGLCHHLKSPEHDASCPCGYRGGIWSSDESYIVVEMGSSLEVDANGVVQGRITPQADRPTQLADAAHIVACSPEPMRSILAYVESLEKALKPFATVADVYDGTAVEDSDPILSTDRGKLTAGDLRSARAALKEMAE